jgi:hypothetical protein
LLDVVKMEIKFAGSGALADVGICFPCNEPTGCRPVEEKFEMSPAWVNFLTIALNPSMLSSANSKHVTFKVKHKPSFNTLSNIELWFLNPTKVRASILLGVESGPGYPADTYYEKSAGNRSSSQMRKRLG